VQKSLRSWVGARNLAFLFSRSTGRPHATIGRFGTGHCRPTGYISARTGADGQCADAIEASLSLGGVGADGYMHTHGYGKRELGRAKGGDVAAYEMLDWAGKKRLKVSASIDIFCLLNL